MKISPRERKFIIVGAAVVAAVMLFYLITLLVPDRESRAQQVDTKEQRLLRYRETLSQKEIYKKRLEQYGYNKIAEKKENGLSNTSNISNKI